jgi:hypothetical protein
MRSVLGPFFTDGWPHPLSCPRLADFCAVFFVELQVSNFQFFFQTADFIFYIFNKFELFQNIKKVFQYP